MATIFISYAKEDSRMADAIYEFLVKNGHHPWMDRHDLLPGQDWETEIEKAMRAKDYCLVCLSRHSVNKRGYFQKEVKAALQILDLFPAGQVFVIPVRLDDCQVPSAMQSKQWLDWQSEEAGSKLLAALSMSSELASSGVDRKVLEALRALKVNTTLLYQELCRRVEGGDDSGDCEIRNSTLKRIIPTLERFTEDGLFRYYLASSDLEIETINRIFFHDMAVNRLKDAIRYLEA